MNIEQLINLGQKGVVKLEITAADLVSVVQNVARETADAILKDRQQEQSNDFIPRKIAMEMLNVKTTLTMLRWEEKGYLQPHRVGSRIFYKKQDVLAAVAEFHRESN
ncbi:hypothetical protein [Sunxiuqinia indica]|uniref:hypothetical protein n=1 Tax=Sunxiuqinia indica TaxID=2692584 RepID=UPI00135AB9FD|nr:hypothetical protein [Sunxiuqinia indica]